MMVGRTVARLCSERGLSQSGFAAMISVDRPNLNQLINGKHNFTLDTLVKIADGLDVPLSTIFAGLDKLPPSKLVLLYNQRRKQAEHNADKGAKGPGPGRPGGAKGTLGSEGKRQEDKGRHPDTR